MAGSYGFSLSLAKTPSAMESLTILPKAGILPGSVGRLLVARLPMFRTKVGNHVRVAGYHK